MTRRLSVCSRSTSRKPATCGSISSPLKSISNSNESTSSRESRDWMWVRSKLWVPNIVSTSFRPPGVSRIVKSTVVLSCSNSTSFVTPVDRLIVSMCTASDDRPRRCAIAAAGRESQLLRASRRRAGQPLLLLATLCAAPLPRLALAIISIDLCTSF